MEKNAPLEPFMLASRVERLEDAASSRTRTLTLVLDGVHDPHNLSAVVRSCEGFGLLDLHVVESHAGFRISKKVSQGAEKWLDVHRHADPDSCARALRQAGFALWIAAPGTHHRRVQGLPFDRPLALVFGNEHDGASPAMQRAAAGCFHIPMCGFSQSFNVSVAAGIALAVAVEARRQRPQGHGDLSAAQRASLVADWQRRSVRHADRILARLARSGGPEEECRDAPNR